MFAIDDRRLEGPLNLTAPTPVSNREFAAALGRALHRPAVIPAPALVLKLLLGEMADRLVLRGQRVIPHRANMLGFEFGFPGLEGALRALLQRV